jgi:hypothetical protein
MASVLEGWNYLNAFGCAERRLRSRGDDQRASRPVSGRDASAVALIEPMKPALATPDRNTVETKIKEATALCNSDKYSEGYTATAKLARFIGHLEARKGIAPVL